MIKQHDGAAVETGMNQDEDDGPRHLQLEPTDVRGLDQIFGGGITQRSLALLTGPPGSGKTTLSSQIAITAARSGRTAMIVTTLAESTDKLTEHLRTFTFFDADLLGAGLQIVSLGHYLADGLDRVAAELVQCVRAERARFVVLDGFDGIRGLDPDPQATRRFLHTIAGTLSALGTTTLITSAADPRDGTFTPETTIADVIVHLDYTLVGMRARRTLEVVKLRGAALLPGLHALTLDVDGVQVYPRLEARVAASRRSGGRSGLMTSDSLTEQDAVTAGEMAAFGVPVLDTLLGGGLSGTTTLLVGAMGTGKTLLGLHFALAGLNRGEPAVLLSFRESRGELLQRADTFAMGRRLREALMPGGGVTLLDVDVPPVELDPDVVADELLGIIERTGARRLVVDSSADLERAINAVSGPSRVVDYMGALGVTLRERRVSALFIKETGDLDPDAGAVDGTAPRVDNLIALRQEECDGSMRRELVILKTRFTPHNLDRHTFVIRAPDGLVFDRVDGIEEADR